MFIRFESIQLDGIDQHEQKVKAILKHEDELKYLSTNYLFEFVISI